MSTRVLLVDDQGMIRIGFHVMLGTVEGIEAVGEASNGGEVLDVLAKYLADVVLVDARMPRINSIKATRRVMALGDLPHVLVLTTFDLDEYAYETLRVGASDFLLKDAPPEEVAAATRHVHDGDAVVTSSATRHLPSHFAAPEVSPLVAPTNAAPFELLTPREREVLSLAVRGLSNREIADELVLSEGTVKVHVGHVLTKLDLRDHVQTVVLAYETGLIASGSA